MGRRRGKGKDRGGGWERWGRGRGRRETDSE